MHHVVWDEEYTDFSGIGATQSQIIKLSKPINTENFRYVALLVRETVTVLPSAGGGITVSVGVVWPNPSNRLEYIADFSSLTGVITLDTAPNPTDGNGVLKKTGQLEISGPYVQVMLKATQPATAETMHCTISVALEFYN